MKPTIIDADSGRELWTAIECATFSGTARGTFPVAKHHGLTLWDSDEIRKWTAERQAAKAED